MISLALLKCLFIPPFLRSFAKLRIALCKPHTRGATVGTLNKAGKVIWSAP